MSPTADDGLRTGGVLVVRAPVTDRPLKPPPPFGKSITDSTIVVAPANISVISARYRPERRSAGSPTSVPIAHVIAAGDEQEQRERERRRVGEPRADPAADREQRDLAERDHPDAAVEDAEAEGGDRVDRDAREGRDPVGADDARQDEERDERAGRAMTAPRTIVPRSTAAPCAPARCRRRMPRPRSQAQFVAREIVTTRRRERYRSATIASTNGAAERYARDAWRTG